MGLAARQSTAKTVTVGPVLDADGVAVTDGVVGDFKLSKNGAAPAALNGSATLTHRHTGHYSLALTASDLDTLGTAEIVIDDTVNACPPKELMVLPANVYDSLVAGTDVLQADVTQVSGSSTAADNLETVFATHFANNYDGAGQAWLVTTATFTTTALAQLYATDLSASGGDVVNGSLVEIVLEAMFERNTGRTYGDAVAGSVIKEIVDNTPGGTGASLGDIADAVWDEVRSGHTTAGTFGQYVISSLEFIGGTATASATLNLKKLNVVNPDLGGVAVNFEATSTTLGTALSLLANTPATGVAVNVNGTASSFNITGQVLYANVEVYDKFFTFNTGETYSTAVAGSVVKEIADNAAAGAATDPLESQVPGSYASGTAGHRLGMLGGVKVTVVSPVADTGELTLVRGDAYTSRLGRALTFTDARDTWPDLTDGVVTLEVGDGLIVATGVVVTATGAGKTVRVDVRSSETDLLTQDRYDYNLVVTYPGTGTTAADGGDRATLVSAEVVAVDREDA